MDVETAVERGNALYALSHPELLHPLAGRSGRAPRRNAHADVAALPFRPDGVGVGHRDSVDRAVSDCNGGDI